MHIVWKFFHLLSAVALGALAGTGPAAAAPMVPATCGAGCVHFLGSGQGAISDGGNATLSAEVYFQQTGNDLFITLVNTNTTAVNVPSDILTGVYFTLMYNNALIDLTPLTAYVADLSTTSTGRLVNADNNSYPDTSKFTDGNGINVGGEYGYAGGSKFDFHGAKAGISSSGLDLFSKGNFCNGDEKGMNSDADPHPCPNIAGPDALDGMQVGIVPLMGFSGTAPDATDKQGEGIKNHNPYVQSAVQFKLTGLPTGFDLTTPGALSSVGFQYGTSLDQPNFYAPSPATLTLLGLGFVLLAGFTARRRPS